MYVGKASSLRHRVNSYFRNQHGVPERTLEMLSQAREVSFDVTPSALEAALLEPDEIKRHAPPYNVALTEDRHVWFTPPDFSTRSPHASRNCRVGPFPSAQALDQFAALAQSSAAALGSGRWAPAEAIFSAGYARLCAVHPELTREDLAAHTRLLRVGSRLWREGRRDCDVSPDDSAWKDRGTFTWTPEHVQMSLERIVLRAAVARRRARWLTRLVDAAVVWSEPGAIGARLIVVENGDIIDRATVEPNVEPPIPPGYRRPIAARREAFAVGRFDRLRVLTTELKRLASAGAPAAVRFGRGPALAGARLAFALSRV